MTSSSDSAIAAGSVRSVAPSATAAPASKAPGASSTGALSAREYLGYALGDTASNLFFRTFTIFLTYYYLDVWGIAASALAWMMLSVRFVDAVNDPIMGILADRTKTRWGKFRPYLLWMAVPYGVCGYLIFASPDLHGDSKLVYAYITYTLMLVAYTAINVPYSALLGVLSPSSAVRTRASSFRFVGAFGGGLLIALLVRPLVRALGQGSEVRGFQLTMALFAVLSIALFWFTFATTRERVSPPADQRSDWKGEIRELVTSRPWIALLFAAIFNSAASGLRSGSTLFYFKYVVGNSDEPVLFGLLDQPTVFLTATMGGLMLGALAFSSIATRVDKRRWAVGLSLVTAACYASFLWLPPRSFGLLLLVNALATISYGPTAALVWAMYADVADYGEWKNGRRSTGLVYSASLFAMKTGTMVAGWLLPIFLDTFGFIRDVEQTPEARLGVTLAFSLVPGLLAVLKAIAIRLYPLHRGRVAEIEAGLAQRRASAAVAASTG